MFSTGQGRWLAHLLAAMGTATVRELSIPHGFAFAVNIRDRRGTDQRSRAQQRGLQPHAGAGGGRCVFTVRNGVTTSTKVCFGPCNTETNAPCGASEPYLSAPLAASEQCAIQGWISQGAQNN